jgi:hypothetical protein
MNDTVAGCAWCENPFTRRRGGSPQRFCSIHCRTAFWSALRRSAERALIAGTVSIDGLRDGRLEACMLQAGHEASRPCPKIASTEQPSPAALKRFLIEVPGALISKLIFVDCQLRHSEREDVVAILAALARLGRKPTITDSAEHLKVLSF